MTLFFGSSYECGLIDMPIYLDHHSTTPVDASVIEQMLPWMQQPANPHSGHQWGRRASAAIDQSLATIADHLGTEPNKIVVTSGATESNNLAITGFCHHPRQKRRQIVTLATEHPCVLDATKDLQRNGFTVVMAKVDSCGRVDLQHLESICTDQTAMVSVAWANNEIGVVADIAAIATIAHRCGAVVHSDATQMIGRRSIDIQSSDVDLVSGSAHKFYGPRGCGFLIVGGGRGVGGGPRRIRLRPQMVGGGQQFGLRGGTMNVASIVGMAAALEVSMADQTRHRSGMRRLRDMLWSRLKAGIDGLSDRSINGPPLGDDDRLEGNLNFALRDIEGEAWIAAADEIAFSSGSACSQVDPEPSHVLRAIGLDESTARRSVRFGIGRGNDESQIIAASEALIAAHRRLK